MAFPQVAGRALTVDSASGTTRTINLPAGVVAGDRLVVVFSADDDPTCTPSAGWQTVGTAANGTTVTSAVFEKVATGSDALTVTTSSSERTSAIALRITGHAPAVAVTGSSSNGSSANSTSPAHTPPGGSADYLWIVARSGDSTVVATAAPAGYSNLQSQDGGSTLGASTNTAERQVTAASQAPGAWTSATEQWVCWTLAVPPVTAVPVQASTDAGDIVVEGPAATATVIPRVNAPTTAGDITVEGAPLTLTKYAGLGASDVSVEGPPVTVAHVMAVGPVDIVVETTSARAAATNLQPVDIVVDGLPVQVSYGGQDSASRRDLPPAVFLPTTRVIAQSILDGRWLHWDLPVTDLEISWALSGPTLIVGNLTPEIPDLADAGLEAWGTWIHVEESGLIRASGILQPTTADGEKLSFEAVGPSGYAAKIPYRAQYSQTGVDPADVVRHLWAHIQSHPRGNLGVQVHGSTPVRLGTAPTQTAAPVEGSTATVSVTQGGPYKLDYWENKLCGAEINALAGETPFDYVERAQWNATRTAVEHHIDIGYPRIGRRLTDTRFAQGENVIESAPLEEPDGVYADQVYVQGKGEGADAISGYAATSVGGRLRLPAVVVDKTIDNADRARARASDEMSARLAALVEVSEIAVQARHPNALLGSFAAGDEIYPQLVLPYVGPFAAWHRITGIRYLPARDAAVLALTRRGEFTDR